MRHRVVLFIVLLAVPLVAFLVSDGVIRRYEEGFQAGLSRQFPQVPAERRAQITLGLVCGDPQDREAIGDEGCSWYDRMAWMRRGAAAVAIAALAWVTMIALAGRLARRSRTVLLRVFTPGLYLTNVFLVGLIVLHGVLGVATVYVGESLLFGGYHPKILLLIGAGALVGVVAIAKTSLSVVKPARISVLGQPVERGDAPELWRLVRDVAEQADVTPPDRIVAGLDLNFFVTEAEVRCQDQELAGRTLFVSLPLARILTRDELRSVIGHELGHFKGEDTEFSRRFYPIYRGTTDALEALEGTDAGLIGSIALIPAAGLLTFFLESFATAERTIGRKRELAADLVAAATAGPAVTAAALAKVHAFAARWETVHQRMIDAVGRGQPLPNLSASFAETVAASSGAEVLVGLEDQRLRHPTDSHPPLADRLRNLGVTLDRVRDATLEIEPATAAIALVPGHEKIEAALSDVAQRFVATALGFPPPKELSPGEAQ